MAYAQITDVQALISQFPLTATSKPTLAEATALMGDVSNEIDVRLSASGVEVPVTAPAYFLAWLGLLNAYGTAAAVLKSIAPGATGPNETPAYAFWEARYQGGLTAITDGSMIADTALGGSNNILPSSYLTRNPDTDEPLGDQAEPLFSVGKVF